MEILYHSIHYLDLLRSFLGEPKDVYCRTYRNPRLSRRYSDAAHSAILNYGPSTRCSLYVNHAFDHGSRHSMVQLKLEGTKGAAVAHMEQKLNSPERAKSSDRLEVCFSESNWRNVPLQGDWFPDAFQGPMANLQRFASGEDKVLNTRVEDAAKTMALVEACYLSAKAPGKKIPNTSNAKTPRG
jgi:predicted dehydrogenase